MNEFQQRCLTICQSCPFKSRRCTDGQPCLCTADGIDIAGHARDGHCSQNMYPQPQQQPINIAHGAAGIFKAVTGTGGADSELISKRAAICEHCEHNKLTFGMIHRCDLCGCLTWAKTRNLEEKCPAGKW